jgi:hypothetical protein
MERTEASRAFKSVSSSAASISDKALRYQLIKHTPWLDIHSDNGLGGWLGLALLLLSVLLQTLLTDSGSLGILLLVIRAEQVNLIILLLSGSWGLGWVQGNLRNLWAVDGVWLGGITWEGWEVLGV